ncbi:MAG: chemotaxis protein CheW [Gemmatimonadota bacterium]
MTRYLLVVAGGETWAIPSDAVTEAVDEPVVDAMPGMPERVRGVIEHRESWLPVIDLGRALELKAIPGPGVALILDRGSTVYALLVETVRGVAEREDEEDVEAWTEDGRVVTRLDLERLFAAPVREGGQAPVPGVDGAADALSLVRFRIGAHQFAFESDDVDRIWPYDDPQPVPGLPSYVLGMLPLRGFAMPVLDLGPHLGLEPERGPDRRVLILGEEDQRVGWVVDEVVAVEAIQRSRWAPLPALFSGRSAALVSGVVSDGGAAPLLVLRASALLEPHQRGVLQGETGTR